MIPKQARQPIQHTDGPQTLNMLSRSPFRTPSVTPAAYSALRQVTAAARSHPGGEAAATAGAAAASPGNSPTGSRRARPAPRYPAPPTSHPGFAGLWLTSGLPSCKVYPHRVRVPLRGAAGAPPVHGASDPLRFHLVDGHPHRLRAPATGRRRRNALTAPGEAGTTLCLARHHAPGMKRRQPLGATPSRSRRTTTSRTMVAVLFAHAFDGCAVERNVPTHPVLPEGHPATAGDHQPRPGPCPRQSTAAHHEPAAGERGRASTHRLLPWPAPCLGPAGYRHAR